jgi:Protein of unknown function (DUF2971)
MLHSFWIKKVCIATKLASRTVCHPYFSGYCVNQHCKPTWVANQIYDLSVCQTSHGLLTPEEFRQILENDKARGVLILTKLIQEQFGNYLGVLCFTATNQFIPMWAHYASKHEGFALEFNSEHPLFNDTDFNPVIYSSQRPQLPSTKQPAEFYSKLSLTKSKDWTDEAEWRFVKPLKELQTGTKPWNKKLGHYISLPPDAIRAVYFGCKAPQDVTDAIELSCKRPEYRDIKLFQMFPDPADYKFVPVPWQGIKTDFPDKVFEALSRKFPV